MRAPFTGRCGRKVKCVANVLSQDTLEDVQQSLDGLRMLIPHSGGTLAERFLLINSISQQLVLCTGCSIKNRVQNPHCALTSR